MPKAAYRLPVVSYSLSGFAALRDTFLYVPIWVVVFIAISVVYTVFFNLVSSYHAGQILINLRHYAQFDFANLSDANSLDYILQLKDIFELALPIALAYFTVIPIAVARSRLSKTGGATAHIGFGQSELIVAMNTLISYLPPLLFILFLSVLLHVLTDTIAPSPFAGEPGAAHAATQAASDNPVRQAFSWLTMLIALPVFVFTYVRTSLSLPYSIEENRLGVLFSWRTTRRLFWPILQVEALAVLWASLVCGAVYLAFVVAYKFMFEQVYYIRYTITFDGEMNAPWFFNLLALSVIYTLFLILTFGPIVTLYRALRPIADADGDADPEDEAVEVVTDDLTDEDVTDEEDDVEDEDGEV